MAIVGTNKDANANDSTVGSNVTASIAFQNNALYLVSSVSRSTAEQHITGISGGGLTWVEVGSHPAAAPYISLWRGLVTSGATTGTLTLTYSGNVTSSKWAVDEFTGVDTSGTNGSGAIVQAVDQIASPNAANGTITLSAFADAVNNAAFGFFGQSASEASYTLDSSGGWSSLAQQLTVVSPICSLLTEYTVGQDTGVNAAWPTSASWNGKALEIQAAATAVVLPRKTTVFFPSKARVLRPRQADRSRFGWR